LLTSYPGSEDRDDDEYVDTDVDEDVYEGSLRGVTDEESKDFEEDDHIDLDGSERGEKEMSCDCCSDEEMEYSGDEGALNVDGFLFDLE
jgi:hypothetical protein